MTTIGVVIAGLGLFIALFPVVSVWRVSGQVLAQLPELSAEVDDDRHRLAIWDSDFVLATRTYHDITADDLEAAFFQNGFGSASAGGERWLSKECCGEYDAVWVQIEDRAEGGAVATVTAADSDVTLSWSFFAIVGLVLILSGAVAARAGVRRPADRPDRPLWPRRRGSRALRPG
ncbi:MAG: hypothetical protein AAGK32_17485 [Actinomycetota bacterium]